MVPALMANAASGHIAMRFGFTGPNLCTVSACSSSNHAIGEAAVHPRRLRRRLCRRRFGGRPSPCSRRVRADDGAHEEPRSRDRVAAVRPGAGRVRALRGRVHVDPRVRDARERAWRSGVLRGRRLRRVGRRLPHHGPDPKGSGAALAMAWALRDAGEEPGSRLVRQRARDLDPAERRGGDGRDQGDPRRRRRPPRGGVLDEVDDGSHARCRRGGGGRSARSRSPTASYPRRSTTRHPTPTATSTTCRTRPERWTLGSRCRTRSVSAATTPSWRSARSRQPRGPLRQPKNSLNSRSAESGESLPYRFSVMISP